MDGPSRDGVLAGTSFPSRHPRIALNALTRYVDEAAEDRPYMNAHLAAEPARLSHSGWDFGSSVGRLVGAIALAREMTGDDGGEDVERRLREKLLDTFADDGLSYREAGNAKYLHWAHDVYEWALDGGTRFG